MHQEDWFKGWFDSDYYHILYKERDEEEAKLFIDKLITFFKPAENSCVLDLGCGKGRHAIYLNKKGLNVTGIDLSVRNISAAGKSENQSLSFFVHDMRKPFGVNYFDMAFNLFTSFGYFEKENDNHETIKWLAKSLKKEGLVVIDFMNSRKVISTLLEEEHKECEGIKFHISRFIENNFIVKQIDFVDDGRDYTFREKVKLLSLNDFKNYFEASGLKIIHLWGDYLLSDFDEKQSERLIIAAKKTIN